MPESVSITLTHPSGSPDRLTHPISIEYSAGMNEPASLNLVWEHDWDTFYNESSASNTMQLNSHCSFMRNGYQEFAGRIISRELESNATPKRITAGVVDYLSLIAECSASIGGHYLATDSTPTTQYSNEKFVLVYPGGASTYYFPDPVTHADGWRAITGSPQTVHTTGTATWGSGATITAGATHNRMRPVGLLRMVPDGSNARYVWYNGYDLNSGQTAYEFSGVIWNALEVTGSSPADDLSNDTVHQFLAKRIDPTQLVLVYDYYSSLQHSLVEGQDYKVDYEAGAIALYPSYTLIGELQVSYRAYNEDSTPASGVLLLGGSWGYGILDLLLAESRVYAGPQLSSSQVSISIPRIVVPSYALTGGKLLDTIRQFLEERGDQGITAESGSSWNEAQQDIMLWLDPHNDTSPGKVPMLRIESVGQSASPTPLKGLIEGYSYSLNGVETGIAGSWSLTDETYYPSMYLSTGYNPGDAQRIRDDAVYAKMFGDAGTATRWWAWPRIAFQSMQGSYDTAYAMLRQLLISHLGFATPRVYKLNPLPDRLPRLGVTYVMPDGFTGVCLRRSYTLSGGNPAEATVTLADMRPAGRLA